MIWNSETLGELKAYLSVKGITYTRIGHALGCSKCAIAGAVRRHIYDIPDIRDRRSGLRKSTDLWTPEKLTETWAQRKQRLALERSHDHA